MDTQADSASPREDPAKIPTVPGDSVNGTPMTNPAPFRLRDYNEDKLSDIVPVHKHVEALLVHHNGLIPPTMGRLVRQWYLDLDKAIEAKRPVTAVEVAYEAAEKLLNDHVDLLPGDLKVKLETFRADLGVIIDDHYGTGEDEDEPLPATVRVPGGFQAAYPPENQANPLRGS